LTLFCFFEFHFVQRVFLDYGVEWENAWKNHVQQWTPPEKPLYFVTVQEANKREEPIIESLISGDLRETVDHPYVFLACQYETVNEIDYRGYHYNNNITDWKNWTDEEILKKFAFDGEDYGYPDTQLGYIKHKEYSHWPCSVLKEEDDDEEDDDEEGEDEDDKRYTVRIHQSPLRSHETKTTLWEEHDLPRILTNYRRESIRFFVKPQSQDHTLPNAFRHHVGVPDGIFPEHWKNLKKGVVSADH
jgi:hypothetical protein